MVALDEIEDPTWATGAVDDDLALAPGEEEAGQVVSEAILAFIRALDVKEIHGYDPEIGLQLFTEEALQKLQQ